MPGTVGEQTSVMKIEPATQPADRGQTWVPEKAAGHPKPRLGTLHSPVFAQLKNPALIR